MKILIVDDNSTHRLIFRKWIEGFCPNYIVIEAINADAAMETLVKESPSCVLLDYIMIGDDGFQTLHRMKRDLPNCPPVIFLTCALTEDLKRNAMALGAEDCFEKSNIGGPELVGAIIRAVEKGSA